MGGKMYDRETMMQKYMQEYGGDGVPLTLVSTKWQ